MKMLMTCVGLSCFALGCSQTPVANKDAANKSAAMVANSTFIAESEPAGAIPVGEARTSVKDNSPVTIVGLIGGSPKPFVDGLAAFTIVDAKVPYCSDDEGCPTPWDYCCQLDAVKDNIATVKFVDAAGKPITENAREWLNLNELATVVVTGIAKRDDQGNLTVAANKIFVRSQK